MTHTYQVSGMTCNGCAATVKRTLQGIPQVQDVIISLPENEAAITMSSHVATPILQQALQQAGGSKYAIQEKGNRHHPMAATDTEAAATGLAAYKPLLLVVAYILGFTFLTEAIAEPFNWMRWMNHFMAAFFVVFSFFKMLDLQGFADSYSTYDIIAKRWRGWGFVYAFVELALGVAYFAAFQPIVTNAVTVLVMTISIAGVLQSVLAKRKIKCACLGTVFNLPMSTVTVIEDGTMILMSGIMLTATF